MPDSKPASRGPERHPNGDNAHPDTRHTSADVTAAAHQAVAELRQAETQRRHDIRATFKPYARYRGVAALEADCLDDMDVAVDAARKRLLDKIGEGVEPLAGASVAFGADETDKRRDAKVEALLARVGASDEAGRRITAANNPYRGQKLADMAKASLAEIGVDVAGQNPEEYAPKALSRVTAAGGQTGSDFAVVLENTLHKLVVSSWDATPIYWNRFCREGSVSDFREHRRLVPGLMGGFAKKNEAGEYTVKNIPDAEKQSIAAEEHGNIIIVDRQALVNDDMGYIAQQAADIGMAGARGVDADVFRLLATNPKLRDGNALFSAAHGNLIATGTAPSVDALVAAADKLMEQKAPGDDGEYLDLAPMVSVARHTTTHDIAGVVNSEYDPESQATRAYNKARGLVQSFVGTPKITGTEWYFFADPQIAPVLEVVFLNGQNQPRLIQQEDFNTGSLKWRPTLDYNVGAIGHRGAVKNPGG